MEKIIVNLQKILINELKLIKVKDRLKYISNIKYRYIKSFNFVEHYNSIDICLLDLCIMRKTLPFTEYGCDFFINEVFTLHKLSKYIYFPKLLAYDSNKLVIYMTYCGELINYNNCPNDWKNQYIEISEIIKNEKTITTFDINSKNICILNEKIHLIDFGTKNSLSIEILLYNLYKILEKFGKK